MTPLSVVLAKKHLPALDGMRAVAVFAVVLYHAGYPVPGSLGVLAFFVLSGFLITWLLLAEHDQTGRVSLRDFYTRRTLRIFPAYYAFIGATVLADIVLGDPWTTGQLTAALTYTSNYYQALVGRSPQAHIWSVGVEEQFYLLWPAIFIALRAHSERTLRIGIVALILAALGWRTSLYLSGAVDGTYIYNAFDTRVDCLLVGCLLAVLCRSPRFLRVGGWLAAHPALPVLALFVLLVDRTAMPRVWRYSVGYTIDATLCAILIVQFMQLSTTRGWSWLEHRGVRWLGTISYPIYLWHAWAIGGASLLVSGQHAQFLLACVIVVAIAAGSYYVIERPFLALRRRKASPAPVPQPHYRTQPGFTS